MFRNLGYELVSEELEAALKARLAFYDNLGLIVDGTFRGEGDQSYRCPTSGQLMDFILKRREIVEQKRNHGFSDVEVSLGLSSEQWLGALRTAITTHAENLKSPWGLSLKVDTATPVYEYWYDDPDLPIFYRRGKDWVTKSSFYGSQPFPGLHLAFVRPADDEMPRKSAWGIGDTGDRPNLAGGIPPLEQYDLFGVGAYEHESAFTVELGMARTLRSIHERQVVPHVYTGDRGTVAWCSRNRFGSEHENPAYASVPCLYWYVDVQWFYLYRLSADFRYEYYAAPAAVGLEE